MNIQAILHLLFWIMLGLGIILFTNSKHQINKRKNILSKITKHEVTNEGGFDRFLNGFKFVQKQEKQYDKTIKMIQDKHPARYYTKLSMIFMLFAIGFSLYMNNMYTVLPLLIVMYQVPGLILEIKLNSRLKKYDKQILAFLQDFITEYTTIKNVPNTLVKVLDTLESPLRPQIELLINELNSGITPEEAFQGLSDRSSNKNLLIYSQLMIMHYKYGSAFIEEISKTIQNIRDESMMKEENATELSMVRLANIVLNVSTPLFYLAVKFINPEDTMVYTTTSDGKKIILFVVCSSLFSLIMGNRMSKIKI